MSAPKFDLVLIDSDSLCYSSAFSVEKKGELEEAAHPIMCSRLDEMVDEIIDNTKANDYKMFLSGKENFRYSVCTNYKANRHGMKRPLLLKEAREHLCTKHSAIVTSNGLEADDEVCIEQTTASLNGIMTVIAHIDKDINQQTGYHYRWPLGKQPSKLYHVDEQEAFYNLYEQALMGDKVDNIMQWYDNSSKTWKKDYGLGKVGARKALEGCVTEKDFQLKCLSLYETFTKKSNGETPSREDFETNMKLLYLLRGVDDEWKFIG